ncbi:MAG: hypothetical protein E4H11_00885, partial [Myxococcales bacterium]
MLTTLGPARCTTSTVTVWRRKGSLAAAGPAARPIPRAATAPRHCPILRIARIRRKLPPLASMSASMRASMGRGQGSAGEEGSVQAMLAAEFRRCFGSAPEAGARAPGRVNLIGEHTDYNEGYVLPMAIARDTLVAFRPNRSRDVGGHSAGQADAVRFSLDAGVPTSPRWVSYVAGVARALADAGVKTVGVDLAIHSTVPLGGGLSSSASLEVACALAFLSAAGVEVERKDLALICQRAENEYTG